MNKKFWEMRYVRTDYGEIIDLEYADGRITHLPRISKVEYEKIKNKEFARYFFVDFENNKLIYKGPAEDAYPVTLTIVATADTVEDLCDEFVINYNEGYAIPNFIYSREDTLGRAGDYNKFKKEFLRIKSKCESEDYLLINDLTEEERWNELNDMTFTGNVWIGNCLKPAAKLNINGEWELL